MNTNSKTAEAVAKNGVTEKKELSKFSVISENDAPKIQSLDVRLHRLNELFEIQSKYNRLQASLQKLKTFKLTKNADSGSITIRDDQRNDFSTSNHEVIEDVVKFLIVTIEKKIKEIEPLLKW